MHDSHLLIKDVVAVVVVALFSSNWNFHAEKFANCIVIEVTTIRNAAATTALLARSHLHCCTFLSAGRTTFQ